MRKLILAATLAASLPAYAQYTTTAYFTGRQDYGQSVTGQSIVSCEYEAMGQRFWRTFPGFGSCPLSIQVY